MQLVACSNCHTQYDVSGVVAKSFPCRCGEPVENSPPAPVDAEIRRCGACGALTRPRLERCEYCDASIRRDDRNLSLTCPECYARNAEDSRFCTACGVTFRPEQVRVDGHELPCPVCAGLMPPRQVAGIGINECAGCNGLWVPENDFDLLVSRAVETRRNASPEALATLAPRVTGANPARQTVRYRKCPECDAFMRRRNFQKASGVIVDRCNLHGTWLDADELERIAGFVLSGRRPAAVLTDVPRSRTPGTGGDLPGLGRQFGASDARQDGGFAGSLIDVLFGFSK